MDTEKTYEVCPICGKRIRRSDCLVCRFCRVRLDRIEERNGKILASGDETRLMIDVFRLVLIRGRRYLKKFQRYHNQVVVEKKQKSAEFWQTAESKVIAYLRSREESASLRTCRNAKVEILRQLKQEDEDFHNLCQETTKWKKSAESLKTHLAGIEQKNKEYREKKKAAEAQIIA